MSIEDRLAKIERESRAWRRIALALALLIGASLSCTQSNQGPPASPSTPSALAEASQSGRTLDTIRARKLEIVNDVGETVALLADGPTGGFLEIEAGDKKSYVIIASLPNEMGLMVSGPDGYVLVSPQNLAVMAFDDAQRRETERLSRKQRDGETLTDAEREKLKAPPAVNIGRGEGSGGMINIANQFGKVVASLQCNKKNEGMLMVFDVNGERANAVTTRP
jgi:hypothetical protein